MIETPADYRSFAFSSKSLGQFVATSARVSRVLLLNLHDASGLFRFPSFLDLYIIWACPMGQAFATRFFMDSLCYSIKRAQTKAQSFTQNRKKRANLSLQKRIFASSNKTTTTT